MASLEYSATVRVTLDVTGAGTGTFNGPPSLTQRKLQSLDIQTTPAIPRPQAQVYRSTVAAGRRIGGTRVADSDTLQADGEILRSGEPLIVVISGGAAGAITTINLYGSDERA